MSTIFEYYGLNTMDNRKPYKQVHRGFIVGNALFAVQPEFLNEPYPPFIRTSAIVQRIENFVETQNTIYHVLDWEQTMFDE